MLCREFQKSNNQFHNIQVASVIDLSGYGDFVNARQPLGDSSSYSLLEAADPCGPRK